MPLDRFVLILVCVAAAAGVTVFLAVWLSSFLTVPLVGISVLLIVALIGYIVVRVIQDRLREHAKDGDKYEGN